eukprot:CAMPEP_0177382432 /NCGR_PEP_ID=MMETSP0368-20130122/48595_1 /TAXON_ID=447022 ORGANISM="Scrippsiella hangoei-like, Strain SHHI-4" /NCGR_SAMPLE_ID=MMETSP0368 /ASSEMBLY_ACC=CAM_ASM_000363 /LENGTH=499 /DNA_ID=CAMNT_0018846909 /DNA_START=41 /DNA_END=1540 /DNA_ORIENTATION=-
MTAGRAGPVGCAAVVLVVVGVAASWLAAPHSWLVPLAGSVAQAPGMRECGRRARVGRLALRGRAGVSKQKLGRAREGGAGAEQDEKEEELEQKENQEQKEEDELTDANLARGIDFFLDVAFGPGAAPQSVGPFLWKFCMKSSLGCSFLVVSNDTFVDNVPSASAEEFERLLDLMVRFVKGYEKFGGASLLADFEGEFPGYGGELTTAQLQPTAALHGTSLKLQRGLPTGTTAAWPSALGFFLDLRCRKVVHLLKEVMQSSRITKLIWGARGDFECLMYQEGRNPLHIMPTNVVDCQMAYKIKAMGKNIQSLPNVFANLPEKDGQVDWSKYHSRNARAFEPPLSDHKARYAVDDLHRLEVILRVGETETQKLVKARLSTRIVLGGLANDPLGFSSLEAIRQRLRKALTRVQASANAVALMRHCLFIRKFAPGKLRLYEEVALDAAERAAKNILLKMKVSVPKDLSFAELEQEEEEEKKEEEEGEEKQAVAQSIGDPVSFN